MKYEVNVYDADDYVIVIDSQLSKKAALKRATELADKYPQCYVYVEFFRASDGQHGFLNPDGNHDITGKAWGK